MVTEMDQINDILARLPKSTDQNEVRITSILQKELLTTPWAQSFFWKARGLQLDFFRFALGNLKDPMAIFSENQRLLSNLASQGNSTIVSGKENLNSTLALRKPIMIASNHLGDYKLCPIQPNELSLDLAIDQIHPFPMYYAPYQPVSQYLGRELFEAHVDLPEPLHTIEKACGLITVIVSESGGGITNLENETRALFEKYHNASLVIFPEGGTSGKRNGRGPYDLERFHTGAFVIAGNLGVPIVPVAKYFRPIKGYELGILQPIFLEKGKAREYYKEVATATQESLQDWLNDRRS